MNVDVASGVPCGVAARRGNACSSDSLIAFPCSGLTFSTFADEACNITRKLQSYGFLSWLSSKLKDYNT